MSQASTLEYVLRRDRAVLTGGLLGVIATSWLYLPNGAGMDMEIMAGMAMPMATMPWTPGYAALVVIMWAVMMAAMMLPSAAPMILLYAMIARQRRARGEAATVGAGVFALGYVAVWAVFSLAASGLQWGLEAATLLSPAMTTTSVAVAGLVFVAAGLYQWTPLKQACLRKCQSPLDFILGHWREGKRGALMMGLRHGLFCVGCCWMLMLLLFVGGVMNLLWIAGLAVYVLAEKLAPTGDWLGRAAGAALIIWGGATLISIT